MTHGRPFDDSQSMEAKHEKEIIKEICLSAKRGGKIGAEKK